MHYKEYDTNEYPELVVGTWVYARTVEGHHVTGFIERRDTIDVTVMINVHHKCCEGAGVVAWANACDCEVATDSKLTDIEGYIRNMIDWSLIARDKTAFMKYTYELRKLMESRSFQSVGTSTRND